MNASEPLRENKRFYLLYIYMEQELNKHDIIN